jgi:DNA-binding NtrC family response regulator
MSVLFNPERFEIATADRLSLPAGGPSGLRAGSFHGTCTDRIPAQAPASVRGRILLVDDNASVRETLADLLDCDGFESVQAADAEQAVMLMRRDPGFDVLVTDLSMPGADGITLIQRAREIKPDLPAILLTGYAEQASSVAVAGGGKFHVLRKPVDSDRLVEQISVLMQRPHRD